MQISSCSLVGLQESHNEFASKCKGRSYLMLMVFQADQSVIFALFTLPSQHPHCHLCTGHSSNPANRHQYPVLGNKRRISSCPGVQFPQSYRTGWQQAPHHCSCVAGGCGYLAITSEFSITSPTQLVCWCWPRQFWCFVLVFLPAPQAFRYDGKPVRNAN